VTRYGCWRGEPFEGHGATGKENAGRELQPHHQRRARVRVPRQEPRQRGPSPDEPSNAGSAETHDLSPDARRRVFEVRDEAGRRESDWRTGQPVWWSKPQSGRCRSAMAGEPGQAVRSARTEADGAAMATSPGPKRGTGCSFQWDSRNVANPRIGCRMQQACRSTRGVNRRSREERQGRNEFRPWQVWAEGRVLLHGSPAGSGCAQTVSMEGRFLDNPKRGVRTKSDSNGSSRRARSHLPRPR